MHRPKVAKTATVNIASIMLPSTESRLPFEVLIFRRPEIFPVVAQMDWMEKDFPAVRSSSKRRASIAPKTKRRQSIPAKKCVILRERCAEVTQRRQLALRTSVSSTSTTAITPGVGCSITSAATVSTTGVTGCFIRTFRAAFFTGARLGLATVRFAAFATLRALLRLAELALRSLARLCTFDPFLRLAMIVPLIWFVLPQRIDARSLSPGN
jgi:hypothetical protein